MTSQKDEQAREQAKSQYESVREMVAAMECDYGRLEELREERADWEPEEYEEGSGGLRPASTWAEQNPDDAEELADLEAAAGDCKDEDEARERIQEDALSVEVRSGWTAPGTPLEAEEFCILLCTGGPAARIVGDLDGHGEPMRARLEYQDWGAPWTEYVPADQDVLLSYARCFCFAS